jgi:hypothetical protein
MFRTLWYTDSAKKSEAPEEREEVELVVIVDAVSALFARAQKGEGDNLHSGLSMTPAIPSSIAGRSVPDIDKLFLPESSSSRPVHQPFKMFARLSRSSGRSLLFEAWVA